MDISIHAPRTGSDQDAPEYVTRDELFQSTLPARGATVLLEDRNACSPNFNPRSPHGERRSSSTERTLTWAISIHAPRTGSDTCTDETMTQIWIFQSTLPARGATRRASGETSNGAISIHAPRTGSDRPPVGVVRGQEISIHAPRTGSDGHTPPEVPQTLISIHAPRTGSDMSTSLYGVIGTHFNPRSPHGERPTHPAGRNGRSGNFNPRSPHGERLDFCRTRTVK